MSEILPAPVFGRDGEPCPGCGAALAGDQRYCLHCGTRRPQARLEFLDVLAADARATPGAYAPVAPWGGGAGYAPPTVLAAVPAGGPPPGINGWLQARSGAFGLAAILLLTLIAGLLLGHWASSGSAPVAQSAAPQVISVAGAAAPAASAATPAATTAGGSSAAGGSTTTASSTSSAKSSASKASTAAPKDSVNVTKVVGNKKALGNALKKAQPISTGGTGKLPPKDDKAAGGGSAFTTIG